MADEKTETPKTEAPEKAEAAPATAVKAEAAPAPEAPAQPAPAAAKAEAPKAEAPKAEAPKAAPAKAVPAKARAKAKVRVKAAPARKPRAAKTVRKPARKAVRPAAAAASAKTSVQKTSVQKIKRNINKGTTTMKNEANKVADRLQAVLGDVNERARTQIERNTRIAEELTELGRGNVEAFVASTKIAAKGLETVGQEVAEFGRKSFEDASAALKSFVEVKSATDFFRLQSEFARTQFDSVVAETSKFSETVIKLAGDVAEPITSRYSVAAERVKNAVAA